MYTTIRPLVLIACFACFLGNTDGANSQESEKSVLEHYAGTWDCQFTIVPQSESEPAKTFKGTVTGKWVVDGQFMEQTGSYRLNETSKPLVIRTMMSFDKDQKQFRYIYFDSNGGIQTSLGKWNAESKTMTSTRRDSKSNQITTIVADFSTDGIETWTIETKDSTGKAVSKIKGTNTRQKKSEQTK
jgi:hypothetical protein